MRWTLDKLQDDAANYTNRGQWQLESKAAYESARRQGLLDTCCEHMKTRMVWTVEALKMVASRYATRTEWRKDFNGAYQAAIRLKVLELCCEHMKPPRSRPKEKKKEKSFPMVSPIINEVFCG